MDGWEVVGAADFVASHAVDDAVAFFGAVFVGEAWDVDEPAHGVGFGDVGEDDFGDVHHGFVVHECDFASFGEHFIEAFHLDDAECGSDFGESVVVAEAFVVEP